LYACISFLTDCPAFLPYFLPLDFFLGIIHLLIG
jgi:hypothetical protein